MTVHRTLAGKVALPGLLIIVFALYSAIRIVNLSAAVERVKSTADTPAYLRISQESVLSRDFLAGSRPFVFPGLLKLFGQNEKNVVWAQGLFSVMSWSILAVSVSASVRTYIAKAAAIGLLLIFSLYRYILGWDSVLLTESLSLSLLALFISGWLWLLRGWRWHKAILLMGIALVWAFCRDTNAWVLLMIAGALLFLWAIAVADKKYLVLSAAFGLMFLLSNLSADLGGRWVFPFQNVLGRRLLPDAGAVDFLAGCGMPVSPALMRLSGEFANGQDRAFYNDPSLEGYRLWLSESGKSCYMKWLLSDPVRSVVQPLGDFNTFLGVQDLQSFLFSRRFSPVLPGRIEALLIVQQQALLVFLLASAMAVMAVRARAWLKNKAWWVAILMTLLVFPHFFIIWHGDTLGIERHAVPAGIQLYLGMWIMVLLVLDRFVELLHTRLAVTGLNLSRIEEQ
jgi:hypothetical protein